MSTPKCIVLHLMSFLYLSESKDIRTQQITLSDCIRFLHLYISPSLHRGIEFIDDNITTSCVFNLPDQKVRVMSTKMDYLIAGDSKFWIIATTLFERTTCDITISELDSHAFNLTALINSWNPEVSLPTDINELTLIISSGFKQTNYRTFDLSILNVNENLSTIEIVSMDIFNISVNSSLKLPSLEVLILLNCSLTTLDVHRWHLSSLAFINLIANRLCELPQLNHFKALETIHLEDNQLKAIDLRELSDLKNLRELFLARNRITHLWESSNRVQLPSLEVVDLSGNLIQRLDMVAFHVPALVYLDVANNRLSRIDSLDTAMRSLNELYLDGNPWEAEWLRNVSGIGRLLNILIKV